MKIVLLSFHSDLNRLSRGRTRLIISMSRGWHPFTRTDGKDFPPDLLSCSVNLNISIRNPSPHVLLYNRTRDSLSPKFYTRFSSSFLASSIYDA